MPLEDAEKNSPSFHDVSRFADSGITCCIWPFHRYVRSSSGQDPDLDYSETQAAQRRPQIHLTLNADKMLYKTLIAAFCISSGDALRIDGLNTRRSAVTSAAAAISLVPLAAFAELKKAGDADVYARADAGKLNAARVRTPISTH